MKYDDVITRYKYNIGTGYVVTYYLKYNWIRKNYIVKYKKHKIKEKWPIFDPVMFPKGYILYNNKIYYYKNGGTDYGERHQRFKV